MSQLLRKTSPISIVAPGRHWKVLAEQVTSRHFQIGGGGLDGITLIGSQHLLPSILPLFELLFSLGLSPRRTFLLAKRYSTRENVRSALENFGVQIEVAEEKQPGRFEQELAISSKRLWNRAKPALGSGTCIILDHGGFLRAAAPRSLSIATVAVEHTTKGTFTKPKRYFPCIDMARSTAKTTLEPTIIADNVLRALKGELDRRKISRIGVVGLGAIGRAVSVALSDKGYSVHTFDKSELAVQLQSVRYEPSARELFESVQMVIGCTGSDLSNEIASARLTGELSLVSASSGDCEFAGLLRYYHKKLRIDGADYSLNLSSKSALRFLHRGFPINLANQGTELTLDEIATTRALTLAAVLQAKRLLAVDMYVPLEEPL